VKFADVKVGQRFVHQGCEKIRLGYELFLKPVRPLVRIEPGPPFNGGIVDLNSADVATGLLSQIWPDEEVELITPRPAGVRLRSKTTGSVGWGLLCPDSEVPSLSRYAVAWDNQAGGGLYAPADVEVIS
jgi:hypothetical protein